MVNNTEVIRSLLHFRSEDDFYFLQIIQRKKDHGNGKVNGTNNNSRLIKAYYIKSLEHFDFILPEVTELCKLFEARAGINLNRRSFKKMQLRHMQKVLEQMINGDYNKSHKAYNTVCGSYNDDSDKMWILDIDDKNFDSKELLDHIKLCQPYGDKFIKEIPSKNGYHLIVKPFNTQEFRMKPQFQGIEVHKNNPTNLFIP